MALTEVDKIDWLSISMNKSNTNKSLINYLRALFSVYSASSILQVDEIKEPHSTKYFLRDDLGLRRTGAHGGEVPVIELKNGFYLYASISYKHVPKQADQLDGISLQYFYEMLLLFRAEINRTENLDDDASFVQHPQPHWHFHILLDRPYQKEKTNFNFKEFAQRENTFESSLKKEKTLSDMHFPMNIQDAYLGVKDFDKTRDDSNIKKWLNKTSESVMRELDFIKSKLNLR